MKVINFLVDVFCIFALLTLGSLMLIVAFHILPVEDALIKVQEIYESSRRQFQLGLTGFLLIAAGLALTKMLVKKTKTEDDLHVVQGEAGRMTITGSAINDLTERILKRFDAVRQSRVSTSFEHNKLKITASLHVLPGWNLTELTTLIEHDVQVRVSKILGGKVPVSISILFTKIEEALLEEVVKS